MSSAGTAQLWRVPTSVRRLAVGASLLFLLIALGATAAGLSVVASTVMWLVALLIMVSVWRWYLVPYLALTAEGIFVRGAFVQRSARYDAIRRVRPGLYGIRIETRDDGSFIAWAVQKSKFAEWSHKRTRADDVVTLIVDRMHQAGAHPAPAPAPAPTPTTITTA